ADARTGSSASSSSRRSRWGSRRSTGASPTPGRACASRGTWTSRTSSTALPGADMASDPDAVVIGSGPNGLAAAIALAKGGASVLVLEAANEIRGGVGSAELTLPGFLHDVCSGCHPMGILSPYLATLPLAEHGLEWIKPAASVAHPLDDGPAVMLWRSVDETARGLGPDEA